ncbi:noelin-2b isoform X2 [Triplophysa dalaica]|uniref:noelin-2b isoform X2 n=1 Tax=Triplophysa dalaica TaxID=1582913 RepID=UPI0024DF926D|nr:noelin-2b isoform X2 [Triplophysa dalaica]
MKMSVAVLKIGAVLSTMIMITNWMSHKLPTLVGLRQDIARPETSQKIISLFPGEDDGWQVFGSVQGKCVCSILTPVQSVCSSDPRYIHLRQTSDHVQNVSQYIEMLNLRTSQDLRHLHGSEMLLVTMETRLKTALNNPQSLTTKSLQELRWSMSQFLPLRTVMSRFRSDVWVMEGYFKGKRLVEYPSLSDFATGQNFIIHHLDQPWSGTGHVVYNGSLYYNKHNSNTLIRYQLSSGHILSQRDLDQAGFNNTFPYSWGGSSDIDLMADEVGLWAVYTTLPHGGNAVLSRLDPDTLQVMESWDTGFPKRSAGESFLICQTLYLTNSHLAGAKVHFSYHTSTSSYEYIDIPFHNQYSHISMLDYNPRMRALFTWNNGHQVIYDVTLLHFIKTHKNNHRNISNLI